MPHHDSRRGKAVAEIPGGDPKGRTEARSIERTGKTQMEPRYISEQDAAKARAQAAAAAARPTEEALDVVADVLRAAQRRRQESASDAA